MANVLFLNATPFTTALNLNANDTNAQVGAMAPPAPSVTLPGAAYPIAANKGPNVFGAGTGPGGGENILIRISTGSSMPQFWYLKAQTSVALDLYFYLFGDKVFGVDQTGSSAGISTRQATIEERQRLTRQFASVLTARQ